MESKLYSNAKTSTQVRKFKPNSANKHSEALKNPAGDQGTFKQNFIQRDFSPPPVAQESQSSEVKLPEIESPASKVNLESHQNGADSFMKIGNDALRSKINQVSEIPAISQATPRLEIAQPRGWNPDNKDVRADDPLRENSINSRPMARLLAEHYDSDALNERIPQQNRNSDPEAANKEAYNKEIERFLVAEQNKKLTQEDGREVVISMDNIQKTYLIGIEGVTAVRGVNLKVHKGEFLCILGTSGGGKSTLLNCMGTIDTPSRGTLKLFGNYMRSDTSDSEYAKTRLEKIGFVFQSFNLIGTMNSVENVELPMLLKGELSPAEVKARAKELLFKVGLGHRLDHYPNQLSGGEQQRVTIARALSNEPELLLMDEPTGDLDTKNADKVVKILLDLNMRKENPITMVMVTHDEYMKQYAHRVVQIVDGKVNREEVMPPEIREKAYAKINKIVKSYEDGSYASVGVKEGAQATNISGKSEIREVSDYPFMKFLLNKKLKESVRV
jgi:putative ABC transport system ATP-binding protein